MNFKQIICIVEGDGYVDVKFDDRTVTSYRDITEAMLSLNQMGYGGYSTREQKVCGKPVRLDFENGQQCWYMRSEDSMLTNL